MLGKDERTSVIAIGLDVGYYRQLGCRYRDQHGDTIFFEKSYQVFDKDMSVSLFLPKKRHAFLVALLCSRRYLHASPVPQP